ncbi:MAG: hypothetical protein ACTHJN_14280 [Ginsengibacter sp.]
MQDQIYKITFLDLSKLAHLCDFIEYDSALDKVRLYQKADLKGNCFKQNIQNLRFVVRITNSIHDNKNTIVKTSMIYFINIFIDKHYNYIDEYNWQDLKTFVATSKLFKTSDRF